MRVKKLGSPTAKNEEQVFFQLPPLLLTQRYSVHNQSSRNNQDSKLLYRLPASHINSSQNHIL